jgi:glutamate N-acetyltransferase/amino-acid N-acetyltransferase
VARSNLFKTAIFGNDPNWGRVLAAVGTTDAAFEPDRLNVAMNGVQICRNGGIGTHATRRPVGPGRRRGDRPRRGSASATIWTNDLTHEYVHENSAYSS